MRAHHLGLAAALLAWLSHGPPSAAARGGEAIAAVTAREDACRLDLRRDGTGIVLVAGRDGTLHADVHAPGPHAAGDAHLWWGFNLYNGFAASVAGDGVTRVTLDAERIEALVGVGDVSFELAGGQEVTLVLPSAPRRVAELEACAAAPFGADWIADLPPLQATAWRVETGPGFLACAFAAPLRGGGTVRIARSAHALGTFVEISRVGLAPGRHTAWFVFAGGWGLDTPIDVADGVALAGFYSENEIGQALSIFTSVILVLGDLVEPIDLPRDEATIAAMERCSLGMARWR